MSAPGRVSPLLALVAAAGVGMHLYQTTPFLEREATASPVASTTRPAVPVPYTESSVPPEVKAPVASDRVTGSWRLATQVESSSYRRFAGLTLGYEMQLEQEGERVKGVGRKVTENGASVGPRAQTPLTVTGTIDGGRLMLNFVERGTRRPTEGQFVLLMDESGTLRGTVLEQRRAFVWPRRSAPRLYAVTLPRFPGFGAAGRQEAR